MERAWTFFPGAYGLPRIQPALSFGSGFGLSRGLHGVPVVIGMTVPPDVFHPLVSRRLFPLPAVGGRTPAGIIQCGPGQRQGVYSGSLAAWLCHRTMPPDSTRLPGISCRRVTVPVAAGRVNRVRQVIWLAQGHAPWDGTHGCSAPGPGVTAPTELR